MACETVLKPRQTAQQRKEEVRKAVANLDLALRMGNVKAVVGPQGAITFANWTAGRDDVTDACAYRQLMVSGSAIARMKIAQAEQLAGRSVDKQVIGSGVHSHDGGKTWGRH